MTAVKLPGQMEITPTDLAVAQSNVQVSEIQLRAAISACLPPQDVGNQYLVSNRKQEQMEVPLAVVHSPRVMPMQARDMGITLDSYLATQGVKLARALRSYDESPTSQKWIDIQQLARDILK